jgi:hypothetical protein
MESLLIILLIAFAAGVVLSGRRQSVQPQVIIVTDPEASSGTGCLLPLVFIGFVLFIFFAIK